jgi:hypothetical protein
MYSAFPSTISIAMDTFGLFFTFLVLFVPLVAVTRYLFRHNNTKQGLGEVFRYYLLLPL